MLLCCQPLLRTQGYIFTEPIIATGTQVTSVALVGGTMCHLPGPRSQVATTPSVGTKSQMSQVPPELHTQGRSAHERQTWAPSRLVPDTLLLPLQRALEHSPCAHLALYDIVLKPLGLIGNPEHSHREGEVECHLKEEGDEQSQG